ncbi:nucleotide-binding protein, UspA family [Fictibacillus macauensis ZFHKF-1]|uniref:Nucleotide-binding protein, UspA family n=1 Tax=Fictibacillus macauensis ZFHKF-1 TaxID=1196324 RepID=I8AM93_9BACL|nr:universal stress protein [Fictibacillus macauensis]EIT86794.1 nucleotide-binding protein, UspA family [Fictibacillus macauensis ZFHKF-1]
MLQYKRILVGVDGSQSAKIAFQRAITLAKEGEIELFIAHISEEPMPTPTPLDIDASMIQYVGQQNTNEHLLQRYEEELQTAGITQYRLLNNAGSPKNELLSFASMHNVDLIICGATGMSTVERLFIGSVSEYVMRHATCDVLIARTPERKTEATGASIKSTTYTSNM